MNEQFRGARSWLDMPVKNMNTKATSLFKKSVPWHRTLALVLLASVSVHGAPLEHAPVRTANPLKGFMPFTGDYGSDALPHGMEFFYIALKDLMDGPESFTWEVMEEKLDAIAKRGRHAVFRVYLDYPRRAPAVPDFLRHGPDGLPGTADDLVMRSYDDHRNNGISRSPDYSDPALRAALTRFIAALGTRYDGDARVGFIQLGLLGFWGEWHTHPKEEWFPPLDFQKEILGAYDKAFSRTRLLVRVPKADAYRDYAIGYHDDSFAYITLAPPAWHFSGRLAAFGESERWREQPIGGEIRPENQPGMWEDPSTVPDGQEYDRCVAEIHPSWMLAQGAFKGKLSPVARERAEQQSRMLGYEFYLPEATVSGPTKTDPIRISTRIRNTGVAPFYYDWPLEIAVLDADHRIVRTERPRWSLIKLLPGEPDRTWTHEIPADKLSPGKYTLLLRAVNPLDGGLPLRFANKTQDADLAGWLTLGEFEFASHPSRRGSETNTRG